MSARVDLTRSESTPDANFAPRWWDAFHFPALRQVLTAVAFCGIVGGALWGLREQPFALGAAELRWFIGTTIVATAFAAVPVLSPGRARVAWVVHLGFVVAGVLFACQALWKAADRPEGRVEPWEGVMAIAYLGGAVILAARFFRREVGPDFHNQSVRYWLASLLGAGIATGGAIWVHGTRIDVMARGFAPSIADVVKVGKGVDPKAIREEIGSGSGPGGRTALRARTDAFVDAVRALGFGNPGGGSALVALDAYRKGRPGEAIAAYGELCTKIEAMLGEGAPSTRYLPPPEEWNRDEDAYVQYADFDNQARMLGDYYQAVTDLIIALQPPAPPAWYERATEPESLFVALNARYDELVRLAAASADRRAATVREMGDQRMLFAGLTSEGKLRIRTDRLAPETLVLLTKVFAAPAPATWKALLELPIVANNSALDCAQGFQGVSSSRLDVIPALPTLQDARTVLSACGGCVEQDGSTFNRPFIRFVCAASDCAPGVTSCEPAWLMQTHFVYEPRGGRIGTTAGWSLTEVFTRFPGERYDATDGQFQLGLDVKSTLTRRTRNGSGEDEPLFRGPDNEPADGPGSKRLSDPGPHHVRLPWLRGGRGVTWAIDIGSTRPEVSFKLEEGRHGR